jgi:hypothetical protein
MKRTQRVNGLKSLTRFVAGALTGRLGMAAMVLAYSFCAVILLAYVSAQIYTYSLMEDILQRERVQRNLKEKIGLQTQRYATLASKDRVTKICETRLGMVPSQNDQLVRVSVEAQLSPVVPRGEFSDESVDLPGVVGKDIDVITEVMQR